MENSAKVLQNFYKVYIKTDRDKSTNLPIDPIIQEPIPKNKQIPLLCFDSKNSKKPIKTQYFNIDTLDTWLKTRRECINPLTNLPFTSNQIQPIITYYKKYKKRCPSYLHYYTNKNTNHSDSDSDDDEEQNKNPQDTIRAIYESCKDPNFIQDFMELIISNYQQITEDIIKLDTMFVSPYYFLNRETILMRIVLNDNFQALEEYLYYNPNLDITDDRFGFKAIDLAMLSNKPFSNMILRTLLFHGARTDLKTKKGYLNELTNDIEKLTILFEFTN